MTGKNSESDTLAPNGMDSQPVGLVIALVGYYVCLFIWFEAGTFPSWVPRSVALGWPLVFVFWWVPVGLLYLATAAYRRISGATRAEQTDEKI